MNLHLAEETKPFSLFLLQFVQTMKKNERRKKTVFVGYIAAYRIFTHLSQPNQIIIEIPKKNATNKEIRFLVEEKNQFMNFILTKWFFYRHHHDDGDHHRQQDTYTERVYEDSIEWYELVIMSLLVFIQFIFVCDVIIVIITHMARHTRTHI